MMVARFAGATLGLLAFTISITAGLFAHNPIEVTLSRSLMALCLFCILGLVLGAVAQTVIAEYEREQKQQIRTRYDRRTAVKEDGAHEADPAAGEKHMPDPQGAG